MKRVAIITSSDMGYQGRREDLSGPAIKEIVEREDEEEVRYVMKEIVPTYVVNEERVVSPYVVKAIGNQTYLSSALSLKNSGFIDMYTSSGKTVKMTIEKNIKMALVRRSLIGFI